MKLRQIPALLVRPLSIRHLLMATVLVVSACTQLGPDYRIPDQALIRKPAISSALSAAQEPAFSQADLPDHWWTLYHDARLDQLIEQALQANPDLHAAAAHLVMARQAVAEVEHERLPQVGMDLAPGYGRTSAVQMGLPFTLPNSGNYDVGLNIGYQLDLFGQIDRAEQAAVADAQAVQAAYEAARITVVAASAGAYADICSVTRQQAVLEQQIALQQQYLQMLTERVRLGRGTALDISRAQTHLLQLTAQRSAWQARQKLARYQLAAMLGELPGQSPTADGLECRQPPLLSRIIPVGDGSSLMQRRPDIRQAERRLAAATARIGVATAELYPQIQFGASVGSTGLLPGFGAGDAFRWEIGPLIRWSLPATSRARIHIKQAEAGTEQALARFDAVVLNALKEANSALTVYARTLDHQQDLRQIAAQEQRMHSQTESLYRFGRADYLNVLDSQRAILSTEAAIAAGDAALAADQIHLFLALGGGWQNTPSAQESRPAAAP